MNENKNINYSYLYPPIKRLISAFLEIYKRCFQSLLLLDRVTLFVLVLNFAILLLLNMTIYDHMKVFFLQKRAGTYI